jgi:hypothetical protein
MVIKHTIDGGLEGLGLGLRRLRAGTVRAALSGGWPAWAEGPGVPSCTRPPHTRPPGSSWQSSRLSRSVTRSLPDCLRCVDHTYSSSVPSCLPSSDPLMTITTCPLRCDTAAPWRARLFTAGSRPPHGPIAADVPSHHSCTHLSEGHVHKPAGPPATLNSGAGTVWSATLVAQPSRAITL